MIRKKWVVPACDKDLAAQLAEEFSIEPLTAYLLASRGITEDMEVEEFLDPTAPLMLDPFSFVDMEKAAERIEVAVEGGESMVVFGDYDADGITATALLYAYLKSRGAAVTRYIPDRMTEGYGLNADAVRHLAGEGVKLIVTVDNGVSALEEAALCRKLGVDLIVTDHHKVGDTLPDAVAVVDPHRPDCPTEFKELSGVGVAFKLVSALEGGDEDAVLDSYADLVALGTIGDVVALKGENRSLVRYGLRKINSDPGVGIRALLEKAGVGGKKVNAVTAAFTLCPRINATGRMGSAYKALDLLLCEDAAEAEALAEEIKGMNLFRQKTESEIFDSVKELFRQTPALALDKVVVVDGEGWHQGVIGIVASRIVESTGRPAVVISRDGENARGSCRSIEGFSIFNALEAVSDCLTHFGGHTLAAGLGLESGRIEEFRRRINEYAADFDMPFPEQKIDCRINPKSVSADILESLDILEPFGAGNPQPCFGLYGMHIDDYNSIGEGRHLRLMLSKGDTRLTAVYFGMTERQFPYLRGDTVDIAANLDRNVFNGETRVSVNVRNIRPSYTDEQAVLHGLRLYDKVMSGEPLTPKEAAAACPDREMQIKVFMHIKQTKPVDGSYETICLHIGDSGESICKVAVSIAVMEEMGVVAKNSAGKLYAPDTGKKVDLNASALMQRLQKRE